MKGNQSPYRFHYGIPGMVIELYLPASVFYKANLEEIPKIGLDPVEVQKHFRSRQNVVETFLKDTHPVWTCEPDRIAQIPIDAIYQGTQSTA